MKGRSAPATVLSLELGSSNSSLVFFFFFPQLTESLPNTKFQSIILSTYNNNKKIFFFLIKCRDFDLSIVGCYIRVKFVCELQVCQISVTFNK